MKRAILALLNHFGLYTRGQTTPVLGPLVGELLWAWGQLPEHTRPRRLTPDAGRDGTDGNGPPRLGPEDWQQLQVLLGRLGAREALRLIEETSDPALYPPGAWQDRIASLNRDVSKRLGQITGKPERWQHHVFNLFSGVASLCGDLEGRPEPVWSRMWAFLRDAVALCRGYARAPKPGQDEVVTLLRKLARQLANCEAPDTGRQVLVRWVREWMSPEDRHRLAGELPEAQPLDYDAHPIRLYVDSSIEAEIRTISCAKEPGTVAWIEENLRPGDVLYDIGANVGAYSLIAAKRADNRAAVFAFEPSYLNFHQLCRNVLLNRCETSVTPVLLPLCRRTGPGRFHYHNTECGGSMHSFGRAVTDQGTEFEPVASVGAIGFSLDDLLSTARLPAPNLIKLDVDGLERDILEGAVATLASPGLRSVLLELNEGQADECAAVFGLFHRAGLTPREKHPLSYRLHNYLFVRPDRLPERPPVPEEVPVTIRRGGGFAPRRAAG